MVNEVRSSRIEERSIRYHLATKRLGQQFLILENCTSTNDVAAEFASRGVTHGFTILSERQTEGRGRTGSVWVSPLGGIWMTVVLGTESGSSLTALPMLGALAIVAALQSLGVKALVRWPNDVIVNGKKLAGVLVESKSEGNTIAYALLGLGINVNFHSVDLGALAEKSTTLLEVLGSPVDRNSLICDILLSIEQLCTDVFLGSVDGALELLRKNECSLGRRVRIETSDSKTLGVFQGYDNLTKVLIRTAQRTSESIETASVVSVEYVDN